MYIAVQLGELFGINLHAQYILILSLIIFGNIIETQTNYFVLFSLYLYLYVHGHATNKNPIRLPAMSIQISLTLRLHTLNSVTMSGHVKYARSRSPGEIEGESASHNNHRIMHISILNTRLRDLEGAMHIFYIFAIYFTRSIIMGRYHDN